MALLGHDLDDLELLLLGDGHVRLDEGLKEVLLDIVPLRHGCGCGNGLCDGEEEKVMLLVVLWDGSGLVGCLGES